MAPISNFKHRFFTAFRELFVHHHGSLEFRAKIFALVLATIEDNLENEDAFNIVKNFALDIYEDEHRANLLVITTKELVQKVYEDNGLDIDTLIVNIQKDLKIVPRYAKKIDIDALKPILLLTKDKDILSYQENILEFLVSIKEEVLHTKQSQIEESEETIESKYEKN